MKFWNRLLLGGDRNIGKRNILWNVFGSAVYALTSMLLGAAVTRVLGADIGGIFFFAFSTFGQQMFIAAYFGMRPVQITDTAEKHTFGEYRNFRFMTCGGTLLLAAAYAFLFTDRGREGIVLLLLVLYKVLDGFADCYDSEFQRQGRLYLAGKSNAFRTLLSVAVFLAVMLNTRDLVLASVGAVLGQAAAVGLFCMAPLTALENVHYTIRKTSVRELFDGSKWLFLAAFLDLYVFAASKYAVNAYMAEEYNSYYTTLFIPTSVINLMANFIIRPVLTVLSGDRDRGDRDHFLKTVLRISGVIGALTVLGMAAAALLGIPVLSLLIGAEAGKELLPYRAALTAVILGGGFYALLNLLYYVLVILENQRAIFAIYGATTVFAWAVSRVAVRRWGINGAAGSYVAAMAVLTLVFAVTAAAVFQKDRKLSGAAGESGQSRT